MEEQQFIARTEALAHRLYRICRCLLSSDADCQDAAQNAVFQAWQHLHALKNEDAFENWLIRIAINECKKLRRSQRPCAPLDEQIPAPPGNQHFFELIDSLDEEYLLPLTLFYVEQFKTREIAHLLRIPEGTVKRRLHTARRMLKEVFS